MRFLQNDARVWMISAAVALLATACASSADCSPTGPATEGESVVAATGDEAIGESAQRQFGGGGGFGCSGLQDGTYCGGDMVSGDPGTLYECMGGTQYVHQVCPTGCSVQPQGVADFCY